MAKSKKSSTGVLQMRRRALAILALSVLLAPLVLATQSANAQTYKDLYRFSRLGGPQNGFVPRASLIPVHGW
jgi:hypothetical protein